MKKIIFLVAFAAFAFCSNAQSYISSIDYSKIKKPALAIKLPYTEDIAEGFILDNLKKIGYEVETKGKLFWKQNKVNGFYIFKEVRLKGSSTPVDLYFKVDQKGKRSNAESTIYLLVSKGAEEFISEEDDAVSFAAAQNFLNGFVAESAIYKLQLDIEAQEKAIAAAEKKLQKLQDSEKDMHKKIEQLQKDIKKNQEDQQDQQKTIEEEKKKLEELKNTKNN